MQVTIVHSSARAREKPCLRCGYSLRKLMDIRHCPECGLSVWLSLSNNDALDWSNPEWLGRLRLALWAMAVTQFAAMAGYAVTFLITPHNGRRLMMQALIAGLYMMTYHAGLWVLATHEQRYPDRLKGYRLAARVFALAAGVAGALLVYASFNRVVTGRGDLLRMWAFPIKGICLAGAISTFAYLRKLAQRLMHPLLVRLTGYLLLVPVASLILAWPILIFYVAGEIPTVVNYLPWIYYPVSTVLLVWYAIVFHDVAKNAQINWAAETGEAPAEPAKPV